MQRTEKNLEYKFLCDCPHHLEHIPLEIHVTQTCYFQKALKPFPVHWAE